MSRMCSIVLAVIVAVICAGCMNGLDEDLGGGFGKAVFAGNADGGIVELGRAMFFDTRLSKPPGQSCASCHEPAAGFADPEQDLPVSGGAIRSRVGSRNAQSVSYAAFSPNLYYDPTMRPGVMEGMYIGGLFWDGRVDTLEEQAKEPFLNPLEMHNPSKKTVVLAVRRAAYADLFREVFGPDSLKDIDHAYDCIAQALAEFMRSPEINPFTSKFDYWLAGQAELTEAEHRGYLLFTGKGKCKNCHPAQSSVGGVPPLFTNFGHQNLGTPPNPELPYYWQPPSVNPDGEAFVDLGLGAALRGLGVPEEEAAKEDGKFKIPSLRYCAVTAPYAHNGVHKTLREIVMFNNTRDVAYWPPPEVPRNVHRHMPPMPGTFGQFGLTDEEVDDIVTFLHTLTDGFEP